MPTLPLSPIASISYSINAVSNTVQGFNTGLIIGTSAIISTSTRVAIYNSLADMVTAGFSTSSPEYLAAQVYFSANPAPKQVAIGRQASGESCVTALTACRLANPNWYIAYIPGAVDADHLACSAYVETLSTQYTQYFAQTQDAAVLNNTGGNIFSAMKASNYIRTQGMYTANANYAMAGMMGYSAGKTSTLPNSAYIFKFKSIAGITADTLTAAQVANIEGNNGNVYITRGGTFTGYENGNNFSGQWFDNVIYGDMLVSLIQNAGAALLYGTAKVPQTEDGMAALKNVISQQCQTMVKVGWLAPGQWNNANILALSTGDYLPSGYLVQSDTINGQNQTDRTNRVSPNIYVAAKTAGGLQDIIIQLNVNQ